jgi:16S rRNA (adenine1518-N6/adenine1519-N6)-dimethyltransferase
MTAGRQGGGISSRHGRGRVSDASATSGLHPRRSLGQNFLRDQNIARKIVAAIGPDRADVVVEIGPGEGALTRHLAAGVRHLSAVDIDERVIERMQETYPDGSVEIIRGDFLATDLASIRERHAPEGKIRLVGNIPYNITTPILFHVLDQRSVVRDFTVLMQKEVARRIVAAPGSKEYGILSVFCQLFADVRLLFDVPPAAFFPKPKVVSSLLRITFLPEPRFKLEDEKHFRAMVRAIFGKRRKTLRNSLRYFCADAERAVPASVDLSRRPEELSIRELVSLSNTLLEWAKRQ